MWCVGTAHNVGKWNGNGWTDQGLLGGWSISSLAFGADGTMWCVGTAHNVGKWNGNGWTDQGLLGGWLISSLAFGADGTMWCVGTAHNVGKWNGSGWTDQGLLGGWSISSLSFARDGTMWCVGTAHNVGIWNGSGWSDQGLLGGWTIDWLVWGEVPSPDTQAAGAKFIGAADGWCQIFSDETSAELLAVSTATPSARILAQASPGVKWTKPILKYSIQEPSSPPTGAVAHRLSQIEAVIDWAFDQWNAVPGTALHFEKVNSAAWQSADIRIIRDSNITDRSLVGNEAAKTVESEFTMNLGLRKSPNLDDPDDLISGRITALHEIGHAIGFIHEHQRYDSGIVWDKNAVYDFFEHRDPPVDDKDKIDQAVFSTIDEYENLLIGFDERCLEIPYDPASIMNYEFPASCFIAPPELARSGIRRQPQLTQTDQKVFRLMYPESPPSRSPDGDL